MSVLACERLSYRYPGADSDALREISLSIEPGEFCVLAGLSGSGKSTLLRAAAGLVPHFHGGVFSGRVVVGGLDTREHGPCDIGAVAGTLLQDPETQVVMTTVRAEIALALESLGHGAAAIARAVEETALALGIAALLDRPTGELSGGELQRVALAAALAPRPRLVLLDEPTSQLDPVAGDELIWQLRRLNQESDTAVLLIEHRLERCLAAADRVIAMRDGAIACDSDPCGFLEWAAEHEPSLQTPGAQLFAHAGLRPPPAGVKQARATLRRHELLPAAVIPLTQAASPAPAGLRRGRWSSRSRARAQRAPTAARMRGVWHELADGPAILRGVDLELRAGESVVLMGRNGAGKSTLLRHAAGLMEPTRGKVTRAGRVALLLQNPGDYFLHERVADEATATELATHGLAGRGERNPRDLSGGERQRLALAIVLGGDAPAATLALDEPTRGMDRASKQRLASWLRARADAGLAVVVATHDAEFAAELGSRAVLLAEGTVIADGPIEEVLAGGWYFTTETARILGGAGSVLRPEQGAALLHEQIARGRGAPASDEARERLRS
ncbi:MAG: energy-coupling factor transport system ATP-binding protein [Solirubrobacteraceae bacterium]|jgi:energy-coupling factor transport system ATP-binding protein|nr:energy-coupling factor transport system ATP-binding protein [Solirubrobacteraceae bacterium]